MRSKNKALVVSCDAGASEILSAWVVANSEREFCYFLEGAALSIFKKKMGNVTSISKKEVQNLFEKKEIDFVLTGTSTRLENFQSFELGAIELAKAYNIKNACFLDHWVNYKHRFGFPGEDWLLNLPDEIWCGDKYSLEMCEKLLFPVEKLKYIPNPYWKEIVNDSKSFVRKDDKKRILYVTEPIKEHAKLLFGDEFHLGYDEFTAITNFFDCLEKLSDTDFVITIRPHPMEDVNKYKKFLSSFFNNYTIEFSDNNTLLEDCLKSDILVGTESMAMVIGCLLNKKVFTSIPKGGRPCQLPFKEIMLVNDMKLI